ncbi:ImmA/IrrE family metallo-endopeptidase [Streptomyces sp. NPDC048489]|uniref:ImmA/IrrE family metallo-endopeptidase n=1 Tax=Streptomyces sp. NPDC048489 TaxID=3154504 RepID=UPI00343CE287
MKKMTDPRVAELMEALRTLAPRRPLTYGESLTLARAQAERLRSFVRADEPAIDLSWLVEQTVVPVHFVPNYELHEKNSGLTTDLIGEKLQMFVNQGEPQVRQRFSLLHEFKHALDFNDAKILHERLGTGDDDLKHKMIEWVANEFAGQVLMPFEHVKKIWRKTGHDLALTASFFNVSREAMRTRLERLNYIGDFKRPKGYFRSKTLHFDFAPLRLEHAA